jgi:hypothetical protein
MYDETGLYHFIEPLPSLNSIDFVKRVFQMDKVSWLMDAGL